MRLLWRDVDGIRTTLTSREIAKLRELAKGAVVLEIGSGCGYSAVHMAEAGATLIVAVDPHAGEVPGSLETMQQNLRERGLEERVAMFRAPSQVALPLLAPGSFDLAFVDGDHSTEAVLHDVRQAWRLLRSDGMLAAHDFYEDYCTDVGPALDSWRKPDEVIDTLWLKRKP